LVWGEDIKGSTTVEDALALTRKTLAELSEKFNLPANLSRTITLKELRDQYGLDMEEIRAFLGI
jgi:hypothetical protein